MKTEKDINQLTIIEDDVIGKLRRNFPVLYWDRLVLLNTSITRLVIDDLSYRTQSPIQEDIEMFQLACRGWFEVYDAGDLTFALSQKLEKLIKTLNRKKTIIIFPGSGSQVIKDLLPEEIIAGCAQVSLPTQRVLNSKTGSVQDVQIGERNALRKTISERDAETILVLDDVIATGATLTVLQQAFPTRNLEWFAGALMMLSPLQRRKGAKNDSGVEGYESIISPVIYQGITGIPPLNSLSTLVGISEKSRVVREAYIDNYVEDKATFSQAVEKIRTKIGVSL